MVSLSAYMANAGIASCTWVNLHPPSSSFCHWISHKVCALAHCPGHGCFLVTRRDNSRLRNLSWVMMIKKKWK